MGFVDVTLRTIENRGLAGFLGRVYRTVVRHDSIPRRVASFNGIRARRASVLELRDEFPDEERHSISQIDRYVDEGDRAVVIGGGWGLCAVAVARRAGESGRVTVFEGSEKFAERCRETVRLNSIESRVEVHHATVCETGKLWGDVGSAEVVEPESLPDCDVLQIDCDGAELEILKRMSIRPRRAIVEIHGMFDVSEEDVDSVMNRYGYEITEKKTFDSRFGGHVKTYTLTGSHPELDRTTG
jgi:hypothetical protein